ncbi:DUF3800 domain-containing protein [Curtobacterium flaccumfaciens]|nr:DUF3800 domain-containing protein [Curtobacterium flaccumfaciens]
MSTVYVYADETGNLDYDVSKGGASEYFGFGTAVFTDEHPEALWGGLDLRARLTAGEGDRSGVQLPRGFHAVQDTPATKAAVFSEIRSQAPRFDSTFLLKREAYGSVRARGEMYLYKMAWYLHFKHVAAQVSVQGDTLVVVAASFGTKRRQAEAEAALRDVCSQTGRKYVLCVWDSATSWGLQVADYGLWAMQRDLEGKSGTWYADYVAASTASRFTPWGRLEK